MTLSSTLIADRALSFPKSEIGKVLSLASTLKDPINLAIGKPDFDVPQPAREACIEAIARHRNGYAPTQGVPVLLEKLRTELARRFPHTDRDVMVTPGTSGALVLAFWLLINPGDEVIVFDPCFAGYEPLIRVCGGVPVRIDTYEDFRLDINRAASSVTKRTKMLVLNSPSNPTGYVASREDLRALAQMARHHGFALVSDEVYSRYCYNGAFDSLADFDDRAIIIDGFSKSHAMTGWRLGFVHGPSSCIRLMTELQQYTFVCAPQPVQWAGAVALDVDLSPHLDAYRWKRDLVVSGIRGYYEFLEPAGAFYVFARVPCGTGAEFAAKALKRGFPILPGGIFSRRDTHFRISFASDDRTLRRGIEVLRELAQR